MRHHFALELGEDVFDADSIVNCGRREQNRQRVRRLRVGARVLVHHAGAAGLERGRRAVQLGAFKQLPVYINSSFPSQSRKLRNAETTSPSGFHATAL